MLGDAVTPEIADAWNEVYWLFATQLIAEEARLYQQAGVDPARPLRPYRVVRRIEETQDVISLILEPADDGGLPEISPGQYVSVFVDLPNGQRQPRQYTVSSTGLGNRLQITVRRVRGVNGAPDGQVSTYLHDHITVGDVAGGQRTGRRLRRPASDGPLLLASAGAGITTVLPIVEHIARTQPDRTVIVAHADRTAQDHALRDTVLHVGRQLDDFTAYTWYETVGPDDHRSHAGLHGPHRDPAAGGHSGLHLRAAAVHAAHPLHPARPRRTRRQHPLRSLRPRPVGRPDTRRTHASLNPNQRPASRCFLTGVLASAPIRAS